MLQVIIIPGTKYGLSRKNTVYIILTWRPLPDFMFYFISRRLLELNTSFLGKTKAHTYTISTYNLLDLPFQRGLKVTDQKYIQDIVSFALCSHTTTCILLKGHILSQVSLSPAHTRFQRYSKICCF